MMKKVKIYKIICMVFIAGMINSCTHNFDEINTDPNVFNEGLPENLFAGVVKNTLDLVGGVLNDQIYNTYASYYGGKGGQFPRFFYAEGPLDNYWSQFYVNILKNNQEIIDTYSNNPEYENRVYIAKIWKSYVYSVLVSTFGAVPFESALKGNSTSPYSSEEEIYTSILETLKEAGDNIDVNGDRLFADPVFNGDNAKWIKFANTLRLKIALRISEGLPALAQLHGSSVMANESQLLASNADNVAITWGQDQINWSYNYTRYIFVQASLDVIPRVNFHYLLNLKTYDDPRLEAIVEPSSDPLTIRDRVLKSGSTTDSITVEYKIPYLGRPLGGNAVVEGWSLDGNDNILAGIATERYSTPKQERFMSQDMSYNVITYSETNFIKAEAQLKGWGGSMTAEDYYYEGIDASFEQYGVSGVAAYKDRDGIKWGTSSTGDRGLFGVVTSAISTDPLDKITRQRWLGSFNQGHDIWCLQKRTRILPFIDQFAPDGAIGLDFAPIPERMVYPPLSENGLNKEAYQEAVSKLALGNDLYSPLLMNKAYTPINWLTLNAEYNQDFATHFYGDSEDDLIAAGVEYTII